MTPVRQYGEAVAVVTVARTPVPGAAWSARTVREGTATAVLRIREDIGRAAAVNRAVAGLDAEVGWVALADPGVECPDTALGVLRAAAGRHPRAGALGPLLRDASGGALASAGATPTFGDALRGRVPAAPAVAGPVGWVSGACVLLRRAAWDSVDGYDPRYAGSAAEPELADVDLGDRLTRAGWLVLGVPEAEVTLHTAGGQGILEPYGRSLRRYVHDRHPAPARALVALVHRG